MSGHEAALELDARAFDRCRFRADPALQSLFAQFNRDYFGSMFPEHEYLVVWSRAGGTDGEQAVFWGYSQRHDKYLISLCRDLKGNPEELRRTLLHELVHAKLDRNKRIRNDHGPTFRREMRGLERAGACRIPMFRYAFLDPSTGVSERHALKAW